MHTHTLCVPISSSRKPAAAAAAATATDGGGRSHTLPGAGPGPVGRVLPTDGLLLPADRPARPAAAGPATSPCRSRQQGVGGNSFCRNVVLCNFF